MSLRSTVCTMLVVAACTAIPNYANAQANDKSGLTLGVEVYQSYYGPVISTFLPGYDGNTQALRRGDVIKGIAANGKIVKTPNIKKLVEAKALLGPGVNGVMKIWRPNVGFMYPLIALTPDSGGIAVMSTQVQTIESKRTYEAFGEKASDPVPSKPIPSEGDSRNSSGGGAGVFPDE